MYQSIQVLEKYSNGYVFFEEVCVL